MFRRISLVAAIAAVLSPIGAHALGLGDIHLRSYLNQTLDAEIDLLSVKKTELDGVKVELASPKAYENAGLERPYHLSKLVFFARGHARRPNGHSRFEQSADA